MQVSSAAAAAAASHHVKVITKEFDLLEYKGYNH